MLLSYDIHLQHYDLWSHWRQASALITEPAGQESEFRHIMSTVAISLELHLHKTGGEKSLNGFYSV